MPEQRMLRARLAEARVRHQELVDAETLALQRLAIPRDHEEDADQLRLLHAQQAKLTELVAQREVFETVMAQVEAQRVLMSRDEWNARLKRELFHFQCRRRISTKRLEINAFLSSPSRYLVLQAVSDSGASTRVPQFAAMELHGRVLCIRRTHRDARETAKRVAFEWSGGDSVSYERLLDSNTRLSTAEGPEIEFLTHREIGERLHQSPDTENPLQDVCCVILDADDHATGELLESLCEASTPMHYTKVIAIASSDLSVASVSASVGDAVTVVVPAVEFPTTVKYEPQHPSRLGSFAFASQIPLTVALCALRLHESHKRSDGDILCFLASRYDTLQSEIHFKQALAQAKAWSREKLKRLRSAQTRLLVSDQPPDDRMRMDAQDATTRRRNVIFASDDVEQCLFIGGVGFVVDSGIRYGVQHISGNTLPSLDILPISFSTASERAHWAGCTRPGMCVRLYTEPPTTTASTATSTMFEEEKPWIREVQDPRLARMVTFAAERGLVRVGIDLLVTVLITKNFVKSAASETRKNRKQTQRQAIDSSVDGDLVAMYHMFQEWRTLFTKEPEPEKESGSEQWCSDRGLNMDAMRVANHFTERLYQLASLDNDIEAEAHTSVLRRIIASGFFMNAAVRKPSLELHIPQYFDLESGALGSVAPRMSCADRKRFLPEGTSSDWIVYCEKTGDDDDLCSFSLLTPVDEAWLVEDSPAFVEKRLDLPISSCEWRDLSQELITVALGNEEKERDSKIASLEEDLQCLLVVDGAVGTLSATSLAERRIPEVRAAIESLLEVGRQVLQRRTLEVSYIGTTRAVLGSGFQVRELLLRDEFMSLSVRNWKRGNDVLLETIRTVDNGLVAEIETSASDSVVIRLPSKRCAQRLLATLTTSDQFGGVDVVPMCSTATAASHDIITSQFGGRIKISWSEGFATGGAKLSFANAASANEFLTRYANIDTFVGIQATPQGILPEHKICEDVELSASWLSALGFKSTPGQKIKDKILPPLRRQDSWVLFDEAAIDEMSAQEVGQLDICVEIKKGLPIEVDEERLMKLVQPSRLIDCVVRRRKIHVDDADADLQRRVRSLALVSCLQPPEEAEKWEKKKLRRGGVVVSFSDVQRLDQVYRSVVKSSLWNEIKDEKPCDQSIRLSAEYEFSMRLPLQLFECFRATIAQIEKSARVNGVKTRVKRDNEDVTIKIVSSSREELRRVADEMKMAVEREKVDGSDFAALFSRSGRLKADEWLHSRVSTGSELRSWVVSSTRDHSFWVYGQKEERERAVMSLKELASQIEDDVDVLDRVIRLDVSKFSDSTMSLPLTVKQSRKLIKHWLRTQPSVHQLFHVRVLGGRGRIALSGSQSQVAAVVEKWTAEGRLLKRAPSPMAAEDAVPDCGVCTLPVEEPSVRFAVCGHCFCLECIQPGVTASTALPLNCPTYDCGRLLHVDDVAKVTKDVTGIVETAVFDYVARHPEECVVCPKAGCNQILSRATVELDDEGGQFVYCESCVESYCLACYDSTGQAMLRHDDTSCDEFQAGGGTATERHINFIREQILILRCPHCKAAFLDFSGCACVSCGNATCQRYFCAICVASSSSSSSETHAHVSRCERNPCKPSYFVVADALNAVHRRTRELQLREYIQTRISSSRVRGNVVERLEKDLSDLGLAVPRDLLAAEAA